MKERVDQLLIALELISQRVTSLERFVCRQKVVYQLIKCDVPMILISSRELEEKDEKMKELLESNKSLEKVVASVKVRNLPLITTNLIYIAKQESREFGNIYKGRSYLPSQLT